jgi:hypothetical protein
MKYIVNIFLLSLTLLIFSCKSPLSDQKVGDLSQLDVRIEIDQDLSDRKKNYITVLLYDGDGKPIRNKDIHVKVNKSALNYVERQELYYMISSGYFGTDVAVDDVYNFEIVLSNGKSYFLGSIKPITESRQDNIVTDDKGDLNKDFMIQWKNLNEVSEMVISRGVLLKTSTKTQQNYDYEPQIIEKIGSSGSYILPKSGFDTKKSTISSVELKFNASRSGKMNADLLEESKITISGHLDKTIDFDEETKK